MDILTGHCPLTGRYFEPCKVSGTQGTKVVLVKERPPDLADYSEARLALAVY